MHVLVDDDNCIYRRYSTRYSSVFGSTAHHSVKRTSFVDFRWDINSRVSQEKVVGLQTKASDFTGHHWEIFNARDMQHAKGWNDKTSVSAA